MDEYGVAIAKAVSEIIERSREIETRSKYHSGETVKVTYNLDKVKDYFLRMNYSRRDAYREANALIASIVTIIAVDELVDETTGKKGIYYAVEDYYGFPFVLPEDLLLSM